MKAKVIAVIIALTASAIPVQAQADAPFGAPTVVSQQSVNCEQPDVRCDGVTVTFNVPYNPAYDENTMKFLYLKVGSTGASITNGQQNVVVSGLPHDTWFMAYVTYATANGCCWVTSEGARLNFNTVNKNNVTTPVVAPVTTPVVVPAPDDTHAISTVNGANGAPTFYNPKEVVSSANTTVINESTTAIIDTATVTIDSTTVTSTTNKADVVATIQALLSKVFALLALLGIKG